MTLNVLKSSRTMNAMALNASLSASLQTVNGSAAEPCLMQGLMVFFTMIVALINIVMDILNTYIDSGFIIREQKGAAC